MKAKQFDLYKFRMEKRLTQEELGDILGYSYSYIGNIEKGRERISNKFLDRIEEKFQVNLDEHRDYLQNNQGNIINGDISNSSVNQTINEHTHDIKELFKEISRLKDRVSDLEKK